MQHLLDGESKSEEFVRGKSWEVIGSRNNEYKVVSRISIEVTSIVFKAVLWFYKNVLRVPVWPKLPASFT